MISTMKTFLMNEVGLSNDATIQLRAIHGIDVFNAFQSFSNKGVVDTCSTARRPGGTISYPDSTRNTLFLNITNTGVAIPTIVAKNLKLCIYAA